MNKPIEKANNLSSANAGEQSLNVCGGRSEVEIVYKRFGYVFDEQLKNRMCGVMRCEL